MKRIFHFRPLSPESRTAFNVAAVQAFFWFGWSFGSFGTVYLQQNGFPAAQLGTLNAVNSTIAIFAMMFWGVLSDRINSIKRTFFIALTGAALFYALVPLLPIGTPHWVLIFFIYYPFVNIFRCSMGTLLDNLTVRTCAEKRIHYGIVRALGSFTFTIGSLIIVAMIPTTGVGATFWISGLMMIPALLFLSRSHDPRMQVKKTEKRARTSAKPLLKNYFYMTFMLFTAIIYVGLSAEFSFISYLMAERGIDTSNYGTFLAVRAVMEVPLLLIIVKLRSRFRLKYLIMVACALMAAECLLLGIFSKNLPSILLCGALFGLGNGLFLGTVSLYLYKLAPDNLKATAQTIFAAVSSVSGIAGNLVGGFAYELFGGQIFYTILGGIILLGIGVFALSLLARRNLPNPGDVKG